MPYASSLVSCSVDWELFPWSACLSDVFSFLELCLSEEFGFCSLFYSVHICTELWNSLSGFVHSGIACLASQAPDWAVAFWDGLSGL